MRRHLLLFLLLSACATAPPPGLDEDPYLWLEEIDGERALAWVRQQNERTHRDLASSPIFDALYGDVLAALNSESRVPSLGYHGSYLYNLWKSPEHPRGIYRRITLSDLRQPMPKWTTVLDIDEMSRREGKPLVFKGLTCLPPEDRRCLVSISVGGGDAVEIREFDAQSLTFVQNGFFVPTAKSTVSWIDENTLFIGTDFGPETLTESGYPRVAKVWKRGTPLDSAETVFEGDRASVGASAARLRSTGPPIDLIDEGKTFWTSEVHQLVDGTLHRLDIPPTAVIVDAFEGKLVIDLKDEWTVDGRSIKAGSVVLADPAKLRGGARQIEVLIEPTASAVVQEVEVTDREILVTTLDNVRGRLDRLTRANDGWARDQVPFPDNGALSIMTASDGSGDALVLFQSFQVPPTLYHVPPGAGPPAAIMAQQATFDALRFEVVQQWAVSKDQTRVPYFVVGPRGMKRDGSNPVHIFSYGGFRNSLRPSYSGSYEQLYGAYGKAWLERGGVFVLANIRGGGEFGPRWHTTVLKENRHKVLEDFEAVAADLVRTGITTSRRIGIEGRSNGGLLTLATMVRRPELYGAVVSGVPLSDMKRYHLLLAGASWIAEYGDPRIPAEWAYLGMYSPYQNFRSNAGYPPLFVFTSTRDDRVHPGHARKTVAKLQDQGHQVWYYENIEGGHGGSSTNEQLAYRVALSYTHLWRNLGAPRPQSGR